MKKAYLVLLFSVFSFCIFAEKATQERILTVTSPRIYGDDVKFIQTKLIEMGFAEIGEIDGYYGPKTEKAVKDFQSIAGFNSNGIISKKEYDFFKDENSKLIIKAIHTWKNYVPPKDIYSSKRYKMKKSPDGRLIQNKKDGKTTSCTLLIVRDFFSAEYVLFKNSETEYFLITKEIQEVSSTAASGVKPHENIEYNCSEYVSLLFYIDDILYSLKDGALKKYQDADIEEYIEYCKDLF